ncbi:MAG: hypothetical protein ACRCTZ_23260, partial [Sarcina sp.]
GEKYDWDNLIGSNVYFEYDTIKGTLKVIAKDDGRITFKYDTKEYTLKTNSFTSCMFGKIFNVYTNEYKVELLTKFDSNNRDLIIVDREYRPNCNGVNLKWYKYKCNKCGYDEGWIEESHLVSKEGGCSCCASRTVVKGINDITTTDPNIVKYFNDINDTYTHTANSHKKVKVKCPDCGRVRDKKMTISEIKRYNSINCSCGDGKSYPEKFMFNILEQLNRNMKLQISKVDFSWCNQYFYDFYDVENNLIIETHGLQHYIETSFKISLDEQQEIDKIKRELALENGISNYIELDCRESDRGFIKNSIMNSELTKYFDFSQVDWYKADEFATKNLIKEISEYYEEHKNNMLKKDIANKFKISVHALTKYLQKGSKFGWCVYEKYNDKSKIKVVETGDEFESIRECCRKFYEIYNVKLNNGSVSNALNGISKTHKGFHFVKVS